jgi:thioredoxin-dependent peroxiredoxin
MAKAKATQPEIGRKAPAFALMATGGREITLRDYIGKKNLVLYFYPKDGTPGCTTQACGFRDVHEGLERHDTVVLGVSLDALDAHEKFSARHGLPFPLLSDSGREVSEAYGVYGKKQFMGREFFGISRTTFVIDKKGTIRRIDRKVDVKQHAGQILDFVKTELA